LLTKSDPAFKDTNKYTTAPYALRMQVLKKQRLNILAIVISVIVLISLVAVLINNPSKPVNPSTFTGEITNYLGQNLTSVNRYIEYLNQHPDVAIKGVQNIDPATYKLAITGMVDNPANYTYDQVVDGFNSTLQVATLPCVEGWSVTMLWQGIPIIEILNEIGIVSGANTLIFLAADGYSSSLPLDYVEQNNIMIAYKMNNVTLTPKLGWPFFLVANNQYGYKWVEWVTEINVSNDTSYRGYWESRGYPNNATVR
jgi:DMSO/TMAO reductase YedYZ molybdopterin-dependent catalytic subunit